MTKRIFPLLALCAVLLLPSVSRADEITDPIRKKVIMSGLKLWYYDLNRFGMFTGFTCDVRASALDDVSRTLKEGLAPNDPIMKLLRSIRTTLNFERTGMFTITTGKLALSGNEQADQGAQQAVAGLKQSLTGVMNLWRPFVFGAYFSGDESDYTIFENEDTYTISAPKNEVVMTVTKKFDITELVVGSGETEVVMRPTFAYIDYTHLVERIEAKAGSLMNITLVFTYGKFKELRLPTAIDETVVMFRTPEGEPRPNGDTTRMTITLANHKLPKR